MTRAKRKLEDAPKRGRKAKTQEKPEVDAPVAPPEPTEAEIAEALDSLEPHFEKDDDGFDDLLEDVAGDNDDTFVSPHEIAGIEADEIQLHTPRLVPPPVSTLLAHCGTRKITRDELALVPTPEATRTHQPIAHIRVVEAIVEALKFRHIGVVREEYAVSPDGGRMFGVLDLDYEFSTLDTFRFSIGLRNSNDKSMRLGITIGYRVFVCDNMAFRGDFMPVLAKHSRRLDLEETIALGVDRMQRGFAPLKSQIIDWQEREVTDERAKLLIYEAFLERALPIPRHLMAVVHRHYFKPEYEAFRPRTLWSLTNAFTSAFKVLKPVRQFQATAKLGGFIAAGIEDPSGNKGKLLPPHNQEVMQAMHA